MIIRARPMLNAYQTPPRASLASNATGRHIPSLYCGVSAITLSAARPLGPAPMTQISLTTLRKSASLSASIAASMIWIPVSHPVIIDSMGDVLGRRSILYHMLLHERRVPRTNLVVDRDRALIHGRLWARRFRRRYHTRNHGREIPIRHQVRSSHIYVRARRLQDSRIILVGCRIPFSRKSSG